jgi:hypothetical protein
MLFPQQQGHDQWFCPAQEQEHAAAGPPDESLEIAATSSSFVSTVVFRALSVHNTKISSPGTGTPRSTEAFQNVIAKVVAPSKKCAERFPGTMW